MDCRGTLMATWGLLLGAVGCAHNQGSNAPPRETNPPPLAASSASGKQVADGPKKQPSPAMCVALADHFEAMALGMAPGSTDQEQTRNAARKEYQQALSIDPNYVPAYQRLGRLYVELKDYPRAVATYQSALTRYPNNGGLWFDLGMCHHLWQEWPAAIECLKRSVECDPERPQNIKMLAYCQAAAGQYTASLATFGRKYDPATANYELARCLHALKQDDMCRPFAQAALQMNPNLKEAQGLLAQLAPVAKSTGAIRQASFSQESDGPSLPPSTGAKLGVMPAQQ